MSNVPVVEKKYQIMKQEHEELLDMIKELLMKDLSARVPYGVKYVRYSWNYDTDQELSVVETLECVDKDGYIDHRRVYTVEDIKPYLFPLSSMTEEQKKEYYGTFSLSGDISGAVDFYNKHHLDWRGLIPMGLARNATGKNIY